MTDIIHPPLPVGSNGWFQVRWQEPADVADIRQAYHAHAEKFFLQWEIPDFFSQLDDYDALEVQMLSKHGDWLRTHVGLRGTDWVMGVSHPTPKVAQFTVEFKEAKHAVLFRLSLV